MHAQAAVHDLQLEESCSSSPVLGGSWKLCVLGLLGSQCAAVRASS